MASWSQLPLDILGSILERLPVVDHARLAGVCVSWRSALSSKLHRPAPQTPWLMLPHARNEDPNTASFLSLSDNRVYKIQQPEPAIQKRMWIGSSEGWLITADERSELHMLNPITRAQIELPSVATLPHIEAFTKWGVNHYLVGKQTPETYTAENLRYHLYVKAVLAFSSQSISSSSSTMCRDYIVVLIYNPNQKLAFAKAGDESWTTLPETSHGFRDVIYHKGQFCALDRHGNVEAWDLSFLSPKPTLHGQKFGRNIYLVCYLVESFSGDLLQVHKCGETYLPPPDESWTINFKLFKMDPIECEWVRVKGLGNEALFLGYSHSMSLSNFPELRGNCIYFTSSILDRSVSHVIHDAGVLNLEDKSLEEICQHSSPYMSPLPIWVTPSMF